MASVNWDPTNTSGDLNEEGPYLFEGELFGHPEVMHETDVQLLEFVTVASFEIEGIEPLHDVEACRSLFSDKLQNLLLSVPHLDVPGVLQHLERHHLVGADFTTKGDVTENPRAQDLPDLVLVQW